MFRVKFLRGEYVCWNYSVCIGVGGRPVNVFDIQHTIRSIRSRLRRVRISHLSSLSIW